MAPSQDHRPSADLPPIHAFARLAAGNRILLSIVPDMSNNAADASALPVDTPLQNAALEREVAGLIVGALNLDIAPDDIDPVAPLFGDGLGLDSIDILEVALVVSKSYGFQLRSDDSNNTRIFQSLRSLCEHIQLNRVT